MRLLQGPVPMAQNRKRSSQKQRGSHLPEQPTPAPQLPARPEPNDLASPDSAQDEKTALDELLTKLEQVRKSRVLVYWTSPLARIADPVVLPLYDQLTTFGKVERLDLFLQTGGGDVEMPWRIVSLVREYCDHFGVIVPHRAASPGCRS